MWQATRALQPSIPCPAPSAGKAQPPARPPASGSVGREAAATSSAVQQRAPDAQLRQRQQSGRADEVPRGARCFALTTVRRSRLGRGRPWPVTHGEGHPGASRRGCRVLPADRCDSVGLQTGDRPQAALIRTSRPHGTLQVDECGERSDEVHVVGGTRQSNTEAEVPLPLVFMAPGHQSAFEQRQITERPARRGEAGRLTGQAQKQLLACRRCHDGGRVAERCRCKHAGANATALVHDAEHLQPRKGFACHTAAYDEFLHQMPFRQEGARSQAPFAEPACEFRDDFLRSVHGGEGHGDRLPGGDKGLQMASGRRCREAARRELRCSGRSSSRLAD